MPRKPAPAETEEIARAINAEPWEPMGGMVKRQCPRCRYFFTSPIDSAERRRADGAALGTGAPRTRAVP
jgi:hypothetical protein